MQYVEFYISYIHFNISFSISCYRYQYITVFLFPSHLFIFNTVRRPIRRWKAVRDDSSTCCFRYIKYVIFGVSVMIYFLNYRFLSFYSFVVCFLSWFSCWLAWSEWFVKKEMTSYVWVLLQMIDMCCFEVKAQFLTA